TGHRRPRSRGGWEFPDPDDGARRFPRHPDLGNKDTLGDGPCHDVTHAFTLAHRNAGTGRPGTDQGLNSSSRSGIPLNVACRAIDGASERNRTKTHPSASATGRRTTNANAAFWMASPKSTPP